MLVTCYTSHKFEGHLHKKVCFLSLCTKSEELFWCNIL